MATEDYPLVTFALFAYNQEKYIREAVESALAQDYPNLEIIISDDCSTDRTFEIVVKVAAEYAGPHKIVSRKTTRNKGTLLHVGEVASIACGELLVLAAGDDISKKERTTTVVKAWRDSGAWGLCSRFDRIDDSGFLLGRMEESSVLNSTYFAELFYPEEGAVRIIHGSSSAYDKRLFKYLQLQEDDYILAEDGALSILLALLGKPVVHLRESLIYYRESAGSMTNSGRRKLNYSDAVRNELKLEWLEAAMGKRCELALRMNEYLGVEKFRELNSAAAMENLARHRVKASWSDMALKERCRFLIRNFRLRELKWAMPRLFGIKPVAFVKAVVSIFLTK